ncbi:MAG: hypothetical protein ONA90_02870 [candidate division KSB1 bacterium]|nr:hypothetical protein [candidate division KSB1 bacterium]
MEIRCGLSLQSLRMRIGVIEIGEYASERTMDILLDYGYHFVVLPVVVEGQTAAAA